MPTPILAKLTIAEPKWLWVVIALFIVFALMTVAQYYRHRAVLSERLQVTAIGLKCLGFLLLALCLLELEWTGEKPKTGANIIAVIVDNSQSLTIRESENNTTRADKLQAELDKAAQPEKNTWFRKIQESFQIRTYTAGARLRSIANYEELEFNSSRSNLHATLNDLKQRFRDRPLAAVVLFTDGNATDSAEGLDLEGFPPIYFVPAGEGGSERDFRIENITVTQSSFEDAPVTIRVSVSGQGVAGILWRLGWFCSANPPP